MILSLAVQALKCHNDEHGKINRGIAYKYFPLQSGIAYGCLE